MIYYICKKGRVVYMIKYEVLVKETLLANVTIEAESEEEALEKAQEMYNGEEIILDYNNLVDLEITIA